MYNHTGFFYLVKINKKFDKYCRYEQICKNIAKNLEYYIQYVDNFHKNDYNYIKY